MRRECSKDRSREYKHHRANLGFIIDTRATLLCVQKDRKSHVCSGLASVRKKTATRYMTAPSLDKHKLVTCSDVSRLSK